MYIEYIDLNFAKLEQIEFEKLNRCNKNMAKKGKKRGERENFSFLFHSWCVTRGYIEIIRQKKVGVISVSFLFSIGQKEGL